MDSRDPGAEPDEPDRRIRRSFGPDLRFTAAAAVGLVLFALLALVAPDAPGRFLFVLAAVLLLAYVVSDLVFRPRVEMSTEGLAVNAPGARLRCAWADVDRIELDSRRRFGLAARTIEIDAADRLLVFSRRALGADPEEVAAVAAGFRTSPSGR